MHGMNGCTEKENKEIINLERQGKKKINSDKTLVGLQFSERNITNNSHPIGDNSETNPKISNTQKRRKQNAKNVSNERRKNR